MTKSHLENVASGKSTSFGPWKLAATISPEDDKIPVGTTSTRIMTCIPNGDKPFCDTWWAVEKISGSQVDLVFGSDVARYAEKDGGGNGVTSWLVWALDPVHNLYSRLLLASATANLMERKQRHDP
ncbi:MAG: hypothetical protein SGARI_000901 [Bacillariaceae sp.]